MALKYSESVFRLPLRIYIHKDLQCKFRPSQLELSVTIETRMIQSGCIRFHDLTKITKFNEDRLCGFFMRTG